MSVAAPAGTAAPLLQVAGLTQHFPIRAGIFRRVVGVVHALEDVSFHVDRGEVVGIVGESGSGKTTIARAIMRLNEPTAGAIRLDGFDIARLDKAALRPFRRRMQIIFQDPYASLNPRLRVRDIIGEALLIHGIGTRGERLERTAALLAKVGLPVDALRRFPHEFSGGQRQRIGIARALAVEPDLVIADEPVSALDVSIQAQVVNLLKDLRQELQVTLLFIAHDLAVVRYISDRIMVMYLGRVMEIAPTRRLFERPRHPYTEALLAAVPAPDPDRRVKRQILQGDIPSPVDPPTGCVFRTRCRYALEACSGAVPPLRPVAPDHFTACIRDDVL